MNREAISVGYLRGHEYYDDHYGRKRPFHIDGVMAELIQREQVREHVSLLRLCRPERRNALDFTILQDLGDHLDVLAKEDVRALLITGTDGVYCAGADVKELQTFDAEMARRFALEGHRVFDKIVQFPSPVLAIINGPALGGGCELACACDLRYASDRALLGQTEVKVGMITGWGGTFRLPQIIGPARARELIYTGRTITAAEALEIGLVHAVFPHNSLFDQAVEVADQIAHNAPIANRLSKRMLNRYTSDTQPWIDEESLALAHCVTTEDGIEGIQAFLEKRAPVFRGIEHDA